MAYALCAVLVAGNVTVTVNSSPALTPETGLVSMVTSVSAAYTTGTRERIKQNERTRDRIRFFTKHHPSLWSNNCVENRTKIIGISRDLRRVICKYLPICYNIGGCQSIDFIFIRSRVKNRCLFIRIAIDLCSIVR